MSTSNLIHFHNPVLRGEFGDALSTAYLNVLKAREQGEQSQLDLLIGEFSDLIAMAGVVHPDAIQDLQQLSALKTQLLERNVVNLTPARPGPNRAARTELDSRGMSNASQNCALLAVTQLLAGASSIRRKVIAADPSKLMEGLFDSYAKQAVGGALDARAGSAFRNWVSEKINDGKEWSNKDHVPVDAVIALETVMESANIQYQFDSATQQGDSLSDWRSDTRNIIDLDPQKSRDFPQLFRDFCSDHASDSGLTTHLKFREQPEDLVMYAKRFAFGLDGRERKITDNIQNIPRGFQLDQQVVVNATPANYELTGCIVHISDGTEGGHYVALRKVGDRWDLIDDKDVKRNVNPDKFLAQGYIFHYRKTDQAYPVLSYRPPGDPGNAGFTGGLAAESSPANAGRQEELDDGFFFMDSSVTSEPKPVTSAAGRAFRFLGASIGGIIRRGWDSISKS